MVGRVSPRVTDPGRTWRRATRRGRARVVPGRTSGRGLALESRTHGPLSPPDCPEESGRAPPSVLPPEGSSAPVRPWEPEGKRVDTFLDEIPVLCERRLGQGTRIPVTDGWVGLTGTSVDVTLWFTQVSVIPEGVRRRWYTTPQE